MVRFRMVKLRPSKSPLKGAEDVPIALKLDVLSQFTCAVSTNASSNVSALVVAINWSCWQSLICQGSVAVPVPPANCAKIVVAFHKASPTVSDNVLEKFFIFNFFKILSVCSDRNNTYKKALSQK